MNDNKLGKPALSQEMIAEYLNQPEIRLLGERTDFSFGLPERDGLRFKDGNFNHSQIAEAAQRIGAEIKKSGSPDLQIALGMDIDADGNVARKEKAAISDLQLGARAIAANMEYFREYEEGNYKDPVSITTKFKDDFNPGVINDLKDPAFADLVEAVADQIVKDNSPDSSPNTPDENRQLASLAKNANKCSKCL